MEYLTENESMKELRNDDKVLMGVTFIDYNIKGEKVRCDGALLYAQGLKNHLITDSQGKYVYNAKTPERFKSRVLEILGT